jgi:hypothetical protein
VCSPLQEIDQALKYAAETRHCVPEYSRPVVNDFIDDLLDARLELSDDHTGGSSG